MNYIYSINLLKSYNDLPELDRKVVDLMVISFSPQYKNGCIKFLQDNISPKIALKDLEIVVNKLKGKDIILETESEFEVDIDLKMELFPSLVKNEKFIRLIKIEQNRYSLSWNTATTKYIRDYIFSGLTGDKANIHHATQKILSGSSSVALYFARMFYSPVYDNVLLQSIPLLSIYLKQIFTFNVVNCIDFEPFVQFFVRTGQLKGIHELSVIHQYEMLIHLGQYKEVYDKIETSQLSDTLLLKAQIELFTGRFQQSVASFDQARVTDNTGLKIASREFTVYHEFLYWLNFVFYPEGINIKKLDVVLHKKDKSREDGDRFLLPLLYFIKKDSEMAKFSIKSFGENFVLASATSKSFYYLLMYFIIHGELNEKMLTLIHIVSIHLNAGKRWLFLRELNFMIGKSSLNMKIIESPMDKEIDVTPCLMSRLIVQEKWEQLLDGLLNLTKGKTESPKKQIENFRICYLVSMERDILQPILQTKNAKGDWSSGRSIALKRIKDQTVEGLTEQDRRVASAISKSTGYYGSNDYALDFTRAISELCGHPFLFLHSNPAISIELIKAQPEIITEEIKNGIRLKTNIANSDQKIVLIKETQTRYKLITLSAQQQSIIRMINNGVTIPAKGKKKLLEAVSSLSSIMTIHSDMTDSTAATRSIEADSRIRVQILPIGDGLKAELFVKPLGIVPPYVKPGKGGKVIYGTIEGEKCQVIRNIAAENENSGNLNDAIALVFDADMTQDAVIFSEPYECLGLLEIIGQYSNTVVVEWPEGERFRMKKSASFANLNLRVKGKGQWFELDGDLNIDEATILSLKELITLSRKSKGRFIELKSGEFLALTEELKKQMDELESIVTLDKNGIAINRFASHALEEIISQAASFKSDKLWKDFQKRIQATTWTEATIPATLDAELRPYQEEGFRWMARLKSWDAGACLADDMGLGKTVQAIAMMLHLAENGPQLVVCPASVVPNWGNELQKFAPALNPIVLKQANREVAFNSLAPFDVLVITYGLLQTEQERIAKVSWSMAVLDEAHAIKNTQTKSSKAAMNIQADFKLVLTGTPIQNHLGELWNLFNFCNPGLLGTLSQFTDRYVKSEHPLQKNHLKKLIAPFILRRTKNKVLDELPPKTEITFTVELSDQEMAFYENLRREAIQTIENNIGPNGHQHLQALAEITKLRLACCNSALVNKEIKLPSAKLEAFFEIVEELRANRHRALVFSQFVGHLSIVRQELDRQGIAYQYLDGSTSIPNRELAVKAFQSGKGELFLISLKAGGLGLNLTAADYVLHLDPWWNPAIEDQASDRAHRIGQFRPVTIYRLVAKNTIEEKILKLHSTKRDMADSLLEGTDQSAALSTNDLLNLLKGI